MAQLSADKGEYERKSIWRQFESNSMISDQNTIFYAPCLVKSCHKLSKFHVAHTILDIWRCSLSQSKFIRTDLQSWASKVRVIALGQRYSAELPREFGMCYKILSSSHSNFQATSAPENAGRKSM